VDIEQLPAAAPLKSGKGIALLPMDLVKVAKPPLSFHPLAVIFPASPEGLASTPVTFTTLQGGKSGYLVQLGTGTVRRKQLTRIMLSIDRPVSCHIILEWQGQTADKHPPLQQWLASLEIEEPELEAHDVQGSWHSCTLTLPLDKASIVLSQSGHLNIFARYPRKLQVASADKVALAKVDASLEVIRGTMRFLTSHLGVQRFRNNTYGIRVPMANKPEAEELFGPLQWITTLDETAQDFRIVLNPAHLLEGVRLTDLQQVFLTQMKWNTLNLRLQTAAGGDEKEVWLQSHEAPSGTLGTLQLRGGTAEVSIFSTSPQD
jgi:hypothetical protein